MARLNLALGFTDIPMSSLADEFERGILGEELSAVTFVRDYLQLCFDSAATLNALTPVTVSTADQSATSGEPTFPHLLVSQINKVVRAVELGESTAVRFIFADQSVISISMRPSDYPGAEGFRKLRV